MEDKKFKYTAFIVFAFVTPIGLWLAIHGEQNSPVVEDDVVYQPARPSSSIMGDNEVSAETPSPSHQSKQRGLASTDQERHGSLNQWLEGLKQKNFRFQLSPDGRTILTVLGGHFPHVGSSESSAFEFLSKFANRLGVHPQQLNRDSLMTHETTRKTVYGYEQVFKELPVFDAYLKVETKKDDHAAYMILNNLKVIPQATPLPEVTIPLGAAKNKALTGLGDAFHTVQQREQPLVVFSKGHGPIDLAWNFFLQGDHTSRYVLVSATTGEILANHMAQSH